MTFTIIVKYTTTTLPLKDTENVHCTTVHILYTADTSTVHFALYTLPATSGYVSQADKVYLKFNRESSKEKD